MSNGSSKIPVITPFLEVTHEVQSMDTLRARETVLHSLINE